MMFADAAILLILFVIIAHVADPRGVYPEEVYEFLEEPVGRIVMLGVIYVVALIDIRVAVVLAIAVAMMMIDVFVSSQVLRVTRQEGFTDGEGEGEGEGENTVFENTEALAAENEAFADTLKEFLTQHGAQLSKSVGTKGRLDKLMTNYFGLVDNMKSQLEKYREFGK